MLGMEGGHHVPPYANTGALMTTIDTTSGLPSVAHDHGARLALLGVEDRRPPGDCGSRGGLEPRGRSPEDVSIALMKQIEMQSQLHAQLMEQRKLQQRIEAHGKYLGRSSSGSNGSSTSNTKTRCMGTTKTACPRGR